LKLGQYGLFLGVKWALSDLEVFDYYPIIPLLVAKKSDIVLENGYF
jgi:hypothetical protein